MGGGFHFIIALVVAVVSLSGGSLVWPRLTTAPRPQLLQQVHDVVIKTQPGEQAANVLGVQDEASVKPISLGELANNAVNGIKSAAQKRAQTIIMSQVTQQLTTQYERLNADQKTQLQQIVCQPSEASPSAKQ